ncbi:hypothetical protein JM18_001958 [Phytophthora kernoviae]|uniref:SH3 domain-containing protein n=2 Tax=Phytophthora kernoviae TaxID=325452 RepID=A0A8T0M6V0_9STRA|nr:hypothetical protein G195_002794 [Phytophthora kernoviae 00238/432]KAG2529758.1 hypothetical protein JM16_001969 [Phytophthora kernoviae]KAG2530969.1 hypothetical protein JM18_001958 [Phytophthora kernoviae]
MPSFCPKCGDFVEEDACGKCGEKAVTAKENPWKSGAKPTAGETIGVPAVPTAFTAAARIKMMGVQPVPEPARKEQAVARFNFVPQDPSTQLKLSKGDEVDVVRKDNDGWWFVIKDGEKGLVPGSYLHIENPVIPITDATILAAREASNQRFMELSRSSGGSSVQGSEAGVEYQSPYGLEGLAIADSCAPRPPSSGPGRADAKSGGTEFKPGEVRKLRKCYACKETILGRTKVCKDQIFHEICLLCKGCRESIEEDEDFTLIKKKAYHAECAKDVNHCFACDKEILGRVYRAGDGAFHKLCMICSVCEKQAKEAGAKFENDLLVCGDCAAAKEKKEREEREAALERERAAAKAKAEKEAALAAARALEEKKEREAQKAAEVAAHAKAKAEAEEAAVARAQAEAEAAEAEALQKAAAAAVASKGNGWSGTDSIRSSTSNLDEFDLEATPMDMSNSNGRISEVSDLDSILSDGEYAGYMGNGQRESLRLSEVLDLESYSDDRLSDLSGISEGAGGHNRPRRSTIEGSVNENEETFSEDEDRELCGGCGLVLEGEAVGALNQYFHYECSHCTRVIAEDDGYAEKDNQAFHQACYQARFGKKCHRCDKVLKGKVVKALDHLYHPDCFICFNCSSSLSAESFFEHDGQAVCAKCKHEAIALDEPSAPDKMEPVSKGIAGYRFDAQDDTQLTIYPGDEVAILQKDDDGWWLVELRNKRGYVPGSYLIERPIEEPKPQPKKKKISSVAATPYRGSSRGLQSRRIIHIWDRVQPSFWYPMASLEQSLMDVEVMAHRVVCPQFPPYAPLSPSEMPELHHDDDEFFKDLPIQGPEKALKQSVSATAAQAQNTRGEAQSVEKEGTDAALAAKEPSVGKAGTTARPAYTSYSYSYSTVLDKEGHRIGTSRRRYEDSTGCLKALHEREIDGKKLKTVWKRSDTKDEGNCETICTTSSAEEFEKEWLNTPFGRAEDEEQTKWMEERERRVYEAFGMEYKALESAKATSEEVIVEEVKERKDAIEKASKKQEEETTPPQYMS